MGLGTEAAGSSLNSGLLLLLLLGGALILLWPVYRRILFGLGTMFLVFGACLLAVLVAGGGVDGGETARFVGVGLLLRVIGGIRPTAIVRRRKSPSGQPA
ncbi:MAG: hypothetical protein ACFCVK_24900 [Acidimicrobiales bacterium]